MSLRGSYCFPREHELEVRTLAGRNNTVELSNKHHHRQ